MTRGPYKKGSWLILASGRSLRTSGLESQVWPFLALWGKGSCPDFLNLAVLISKLGMRISAMCVLRIRYLKRENTTRISDDLLPGRTSCLVVTRTLITTNLPAYLFTARHCVKCHALFTVFYLIHDDIDFKMHHYWMYHQERKRCQLTSDTALTLRCVLISQMLMCVCCGGEGGRLHFSISFKPTTNLG